MKNNHHHIARTPSPRERLSEIGSILSIAIRRLYIRERDHFSKDSLDFVLNSSVTTPATSYERIK